uniref:Uncharacterized protein n=2 Tax=Anguilla anguilla TaxID=7936 RepID=A0A0E9VKW4_ANGAN
MAPKVKSIEMVFFFPKARYLLSHGIHLPVLTNFL